MKKLLTSLLCVMMVVCFMPSMAWAADTPAAGTTVTEGTVPTESNPTDTDPTEGTGDNAGQNSNPGEGGDSANPGTGDAGATGTEGGGEDPTTTCPDGADCTHEAAIESIHYDTVEEAVAAAAAGDTVKVLRDVTVGEAVGGESAFNFAIAQDITLDLGNHTLSGAAQLTVGLSGNNNVKITNGTLTGGTGYVVYINSKAAKLTLENVTVTGGNVSTSAVYIKGESPELILDHVTVTGGTAPAAVYIRGESPKLTMKNTTTVTGGKIAVIYIKSDAAKVILENATVTGDTNSQKAVYIQGKAPKLTLENTAVTGGTNSEDTVFIQNGAPELIMKNATVTDGTKSAICINRQSVTPKLILNHVTVTSRVGACGIEDDGVKSSLTLNHCDVSGDLWAIYHNGQTAGFNLIATDSKITAIDGINPNYCAIYVSASEAISKEHGRNVINLTKCTVTGPTGIEGKYTDMTLDNCNITATAEKAGFVQNNNGSTSVGFAVVSTDNSMIPDAPKPEGIININDGNYEGLVGLSQYKDITEGFKETTYNVTGGTFSTDVKYYMAEGYNEYKRNDGKYIVASANAAPAHSDGFNTWTKDETNGYYVESYVAPYIPPVTPADNVTNSGTTGTDTATTTADINTTASNGTANAVVDQTTADKIVKKATDNKSAEVVVDAKTSAGTAENTTVTLPTETVKDIVEKTDAEVTVETDAAEVTLDQKAVEAVATKATGSDVQIVVEKTKDETKEMEFELKVVSGGVVIGEFDGGNVKVTVKLNASLAALKDAALTCVHIADDGTYTKVGGAKNNDGTYTFTTTHFSSYMIMAEEEADKVIDEQTLEAVKATKLVARTEMSKAKGKKAVKVYWYAKDGSELSFDGYEVYRSLKRYEGYGTKPFFETTKTKYYNTAVKKGTRYYYKVRGYKMINGEKAYTEYSTKAWRTVK